MDPRAQFADHVKSVWSNPRIQKSLSYCDSQQVVIAINEDLRNAQTPDKIWISYKKLFDTVTEGAVILLDDGAIEVTRTPLYFPL